MSNDNSITGWLKSLENNGDEAAQEIWNKFHKRLVAVAMRRMRGAPGRLADGDDVVNDAFATFYRRFDNGEYPDLKDRDGLWRLLLTITENKARRQMRHDLADKRGAGQVRGESVFLSGNEPKLASGFDRFAGIEPTPEDAVILNETLNELLGHLTAEQREISMLRMQAYSNQEISERMKLSIATVERRLRQIRENWSKSADAAEI